MLPPTHLEHFAAQYRVAATHHPDNPVRYLAADLGVHRSTIGLWIRACRELGLLPPSVGRRSNWTDDELAAIAQRIDSGYATARSIAKEKGVDATALYRLLSRHGLARRSNGHISWPATLRLPDDPALVGYIAGLIDGEGSIVPIKEAKRWPNSQAPQCPRWHVKIGMTDEPVIRWLGSFGGSVHQQPEPKPPRKPCWFWDVARRLDVQMLLAATLPYLRVPAKAEKAKRALENYA